ncbi:hypothetical protein LB505_001126 [Fusarium chuoi]|nr:hypothetical protein LB505_001126 [Fusarium chuoi]
MARRNSLLSNVTSPTVIHSPQFPSPWNTHPKFSTPDPRCHFGRLLQDPPGAVESRPFTRSFMPVAGERTVHLAPK